MTAMSERHGKRPIMWIDRQRVGVVEEISGVASR
ncbi:hypothetical protein SAMN05444365_102420 [Micromonospora pattaloongensis]|uniref:Uncharacterized protein n=1 Tax=Micromonospora pattaloongensis TaxID=405436 RepID=A0A1H3K9X0_9ACTN|nr:hypothetical protein SAMN05444365_102420 [Micromonospora pattaloongensis]